MSKFAQEISRIAGVDYDEALKIEDVMEDAWLLPDHSEATLRQFKRAIKTAQTMIAEGYTVQA